jgi:hypothetical protein
MKREFPQVIKDVGFDFSWDERKVWLLDVPVEDIPISELTWHFAIPFWSKPGGFYDLKAQDVINDPDKYKVEYDRTMQADTSHPIDIMLWRGRWLILDGLHRLVKLSIQGAETVKVRKIPKSAIPLITKDPQ